MVGTITDVHAVTRHSFQDTGDTIFLLGLNQGELGGSEYLYRVYGRVEGDPPRVDLETERTLQRCLLAMISQGVIKSAHDVANGGLAATLTECCLGMPRQGPRPGASVHLGDALPNAALLFGEDHGRVVVSCAPEDADTVHAVTSAHGVPCEKIGSVGKPESPLKIVTGAGLLSLSLDRLRRRYFGCIPKIMNSGAVS